MQFITSVQECLYKGWLKWLYAWLSLKERVLHMPDEAGPEHLSFFDSVSPHSDKRPGRPILLLHGFTDDKETWLKMIGVLGKNHRVIGVDLAGHGRSSAACDGEYGRVIQAERVHRLVVKCGLKNHHLLGHSMGGAVAMTYAIAHPDEVLSLGLIAPAGLEDPHTTEFKGHAGGEINPLIIADNWNANEKVRYVANGPNSLYFFVRLVNSYLTQEGLVREQLYRKIFRQLSEEGSLSKEDLQQINQPTFVVWGTRDRVLKPSCLDHLAAHIPGTRVVKQWEGVGHMVNLEKPRMTAKAYLGFLDRLKNTEH